MEELERKYPVGIQTFSEIIEQHYVYVDKTDIVWQMAHYAKFIFFSRPRRFGKSLLTTTLEAYFEGRKDLFEGLKINAYEKEWVEYPVIRLDLSEAKNMGTASALESKIMLLLNDYTDLYGRDENETTPGGLFRGLIRRAFAQTGRQVVVILDEYDAPLLGVLHDEKLNDFRRVMQEFYSVLKANERFLRYCFITGITKFSQLSIFSSMNNLMNITLQEEFSTVCGISHEELDTTLWPDVERLARRNDCTAEEMRAKLNDMYDGYHFAKDIRGVYNPFSLFKAFLSGELEDFWFDSGTPTYLIRQMEKFGTDITAMDSLEVSSSAFDRPTENMIDALPLLYQSGYLTIKGYDRETKEYTLSIPNTEVRVGYTDNLLPIYTGLEGSNVQSGFAKTFWKALKKRDVNEAMWAMRTYLSGVPYVEGFKKKLAQAATAEGFYEYTMYLIFSMLNVYVRTQVKCKGGRADVVVSMPDTTWVFELKVNGSAESAMEQINSRGYYLQYKTEGKKVVKVGVEFEQATMAVGRWVYDEGNGVVEGEE